MKKKLAALLCGIIFACLLAVPVYAQSEPAITITEESVYSGDEVIVAGTGAASTTTETIEGVPYITKVYELPQGADTSGYTAAFEKDGCLFKMHDTSRQVQEGQTDSKTVTQTESLESESKKIADITALAAPMVLYSEDGYTGQLALDVGAIVVEANGTSTYSYRVEDVREYTNLDRNDAAYVPKTVLKDGATLELEHIEWVIMGQHPVDGGMVPNLFKAVATYAGAATGNRANGYIATLTYTGEVTRTTPGKTVFTVVFRGEPLAPVESEPETKPPTATKNSSGKSLFALIFIVLVSAAILSVGGVRLAGCIRDKRGRQGKDYPTEKYDDFGFGEAEPAEPFAEDICSRVYPQGQAPQTYPEDEFDDLFTDEGFFNEDE